MKLSLGRILGWARLIRPTPGSALVLHGFLLKQMFVIIDILVLYVTAGTTGLLIWAVTLAGLLGGGALLVYNTSALAS